MIIRTIFASILLAFVLPSNAASNGDWQLEYERTNIKIHTRAVAGSKFLQTKAEIKLNVSAKLVLAKLSVSDRCWDWQARCKKSTTIKQISENESIVYAVINMPWPLSDRDFVFRSVYIIDAENKTIKIELSPAKGKYAKTKYVRGSGNATYIIKELSASESELIIEMHTEFAGSISPKLLNSKLVSELRKDIDLLIKLLKTKETT